MSRPDWSLRANGETYLDQANESRFLSRRIQNSTGSVTGIAGERGAGKSSLAQRVLSDCEKQNAFTLLIQSPTGYEPREFLVSIFQRVCEAIESRIESQIEDLDKQSMRDVNRRLIVVLAASLVATFLLASGPGYIYYQRYDAALQSLIEEYSYLSPESADEIRSNNSLPPSFKHAITGLVFATMACIAFGLVYFFVVPSWRRLRYARKNRLKFKLMRHASALSQRLQFETKRSVSAGIGTSVVKLGARRTIASRPLSMPGITSEMIGFLEEICDVYPYVVLCLDELDKITDPRDLDGVLRGIKGVLGQRKTHFILTVSEDALSRFIVQHQTQRGMLESAFETIIPLRRVDLRVSEHIVGLMCGKANANEGGGIGKPNPSTVIFWLLGSALPRGIKRNVLRVLERCDDPRKMSTQLLWRILVSARIGDLHNWALRVDSDRVATRGFLTHLHESQEILEALSNDIEDRAGMVECVEVSDAIVELWTLGYKDYFGDHDDDEARGVQSREVDGWCSSPELGVDLRGPVIEMVVAASALKYVKRAATRGFSGGLTHELIRVFELAPCSPTLAWKILGKVLVNIGYGGPGVEGQDDIRRDA